MQGEDPIANFLAMTGCPSEETAIDYLSMTDFDVTSAVVLYQADRGGSTAAADQPTPPLSDPAQRQAPPVVDVAADDDDLTAYLAHLRQEPTPPTATDTSDASPSHIATLSSFDPVFPTRPVDNPERTSNVFEGVAGERLQRMFATPDYVHRNESFERVCAGAQRRDHWVLVALRDESFISNCIARDLWNSDLMATVAPHLECVEYDVGTPVGEQCANSFHITSDGIPCLFLVDPLTCHREKNLPLVRARNGGLEGGAVVDELLIFIATNGSPNQLHVAMEGSEVQGHESTSTVDVDADGDGDGEDGDSARFTAPAAAESHVVLSDPQPQQVAVPEVSLEEWAVAPEDADSFKLRVRLPKTNPTLCLRPQTPVSVLFRYLAYRVHADDPTTYPSPPPIEVRGGFPPKILTPPPEDAAPLSAWTGARSGDALTVHIK